MERVLDTSGGLRYAVEDLPKVVVSIGDEKSSNVIIGSRAMKHHFPDFREPKDWDEFHPRSVEGIDGFWHESFDPSWADERFATVDELYTIKASHAAWSLRNGSWNKHMYDLMFLQQRGAKLDQEMYDILVPVWKETHGKKKTNLAMTKNDFFADAVVRKYDHDSLHLALAYRDVPWYTKFLVPGEEVLTSWDAFNNLAHDEKMEALREEIMVTAVERWLIPQDFKASPRAAYARALKLCITSLFKGRWVQVFVENYSELYAPDVDYAQRFHDNSDRLILL